MSATVVVSDTPEVVGETPAPVGEAAAAAAVEIAEINAERDVALAELHVEAEEARVEAAAEIVTQTIEERLDVCQNRVENIAATVTALPGVMAEMLSDLETRLTERLPPQPQPPSEAVVAPEKTVEQVEAPPAPPAKEKEQTVSVDLSSLTGLFVACHALLAERTGIPELALPMEEGEQFMTAAQNVMRHYNVETTQKTMDWLAFAGCTVMIYGPRIGAVMQHRNSKGAPKRPVNDGPQPLNIVPAAE